MSQIGYVSWYSDAPQLDPVKVADAFMSLLGITTADYVFRSNGIARSYDDPDWSTECVGEKVEADALPNLFRPGTQLNIDADNALFGETMETMLRREIPVEVVGDFIPNRPFFSIGEGYFVDAADPLGRQVRYRAMVGCWGYSTPNDGKAFRREFEKMPFVRDITAKLEPVLGHVSIGIYFYF